MAARLRRLLLMFLFALTTSAGFAADIEGQKPLLLVGDAFHFVPGAWADYDVTDTAKKETYRLRIATLGRESKGPPATSWMEIEVAMADTPTVVTRFLVEETPEGPGNLHEVIVQMRGYSPFYVPRKYFRGKDKEVGDFRPVREVRRVAETTLTLGGRDIPAIRVEALDADGKPVTATVSTAVPPIGVVSADANGMTMTLRDWGDGARSRIDGMPLNFYLWLIKQVGQEFLR